MGVLWVPVSGDVDLSTGGSDSVMDEDVVRDNCPLALQLATLSYRRLQGEDEDEEEEEDDEEHVVDWAPVRSGGVVKAGPAVYNVTGRSVHALHSTCWLFLRSCPFRVAEACMH